jgi:hypothetical protein
VLQVLSVLLLMLAVPLLLLLLLLLEGMAATLALLLVVQLPLCVVLYWCVLLYQLACSACASALDGQPLQMTDSTAQVQLLVPMDIMMPGSLHVNLYCHHNSPCDHMRKHIPSSRHCQRSHMSADYSSVQTLHQASF